MSTEQVLHEVVSEAKTEKAVKKSGKIFCHAYKEKGDDKYYHLCRHKEDHEGQHHCCACATTW
jgi:hypothetical protein